MKINAVNQSAYIHNSNTNFRAHIVNTPTLQKAIEYASPNWIKELNNTLGKIPDKMLVELNQSSRGYMMCSLKDGANTEIQILTNDIISKEVLFRCLSDSTPYRRCFRHTRRYPPFALRLLPRVWLMEE